MAYEISNLIAADRALGKHIAGCEWKSRLKDLQEFNARAIKDKIYRGDNEDPERFLKQLAKTLPDKLKLPIVGYFRRVGFGIDFEDQLPNTARLTNTDQSRSFEVEVDNYMFGYDFCIIAHGAATIHEVGLPLHRYLNKKRYFNIPFQLCKDETANKALKFNLKAMLKETRTIQFDNATPVKDNITQVYAARGSYEVQIPMVFAEEVEPIIEEIEFIPMIAY